MPRHRPIIAAPLPAVDWGQYAPQMRGRVALALEQARRLPHCLFCRRTRGTPAVWLPPDAQTIGGDDVKPVPYKLCQRHTHAAVESIAQALARRG
jgi:hypothetical protein